MGMGIAIAIGFVVLIFIGGGNQFRKTKPMTMAMPMPMPMPILVGSFFQNGSGPSGSGPSWFFRRLLNCSLPRLIDPLIERSINLVIDRMVYCIGHHKLAVQHGINTES